MDDLKFLTPQHARKTLEAMEINAAEQIAIIAKTIHTELNRMHTGFSPLGLSLDSILEVVAKIGIRASKIPNGHNGASR